MFLDDPGNFWMGSDPGAHDPKRPPKATETHAAQAGFDVKRIMLERK